MFFKTTPEIFNQSINEMWQLLQSKVNRIANLDIETDKKSNDK